MRNEAVRVFASTSVGSTIAVAFDCLPPWKNTNPARRFAASAFAGRYAWKKTYSVLLFGENSGHVGHMRSPFTSSGDSFIFVSTPSALRCTSAVFRTCTIWLESITVLKAQPARICRQQRQVLFERPDAPTFVFARQKLQVIFAGAQ